VDTTARNDYDGPHAMQLERLARNRDDYTVRKP
jgi:hypothetical protein